MYSLNNWFSRASNDEPCSGARLPYAPTEFFRLIDVTNNRLPIDGREVLDAL
jgi:hypothetical protein